jgi:1,4-alpha-glucan branching enzyme
MVRVDDQFAEFSFYRPQARRVHLTGDFNDWREGELPMTRTPDGYWTARMRLPAGEFRFRYCADGEWFTDFAAFGVEPGRFGLDSILRIPVVPLSFQAAAPVEAATPGAGVAAA